ncbi:MAG: hypothetical protein LBC46_05640 [Treponema sp.]|jgi:outer membrane murein-binding lipoprotein Lpp|nr:hypothetical protein [Treponema sp.]
MKRIVQLLVMCSLAAFVLAGCSNKDPTAKKLDEIKGAASQAAKDIQREASDAAKDLKQGASDVLEDASKAAEELLQNIKK